MEFLAEYGLFLLKVITIVVSIVLLVAGVAAVSIRQKQQAKGHFEITNLNEKYDEIEEQLNAEVLDSEVFKREQKEKQKEEKAQRKAKKKIKGPENDIRKPHVYVIDFDGDIKASAVEQLREEITALLRLAKESDKILLRLESPGGMVHAYGLAASQLARIRNKGIELIVSVDKVAASGGYMMACVADKIYAAPFAVIGSIGVVAQIPNFNKILKKHDVDYEVLTAGEYKRTLTMFGENTDKAREKFQQDLEDTHVLFKSFIKDVRPVVNIEEVSDGDIWYGQQAIENKLIDHVSTSDSLIQQYCEDHAVYLVEYIEKKSFQSKLGLAASHVTESIFSKLLEKNKTSQWYK